MNALCAMNAPGNHKGYPYELPDVPLPGIKPRR